MKAVSIGVVKACRGMFLVATASVLAVIMTTGNGCSVYMASKQPGRKDLNVLAAGTPRSLVLAELGQPRASEMKDGKRVDVFSFVQGYSKGAKAGRAFFHGAADVVTLGMWEVVGTPTEAVFDGKKLAYEVTYDANDKVEKVLTLTTGKEEIKTQPTQETKVESTSDTTTEPAAEPSREEVPTNEDYK